MYAVIDEQNTPLGSWLGHFHRLFRDEERPCRVEYTVVERYRNCSHETGS